MSHFYGTMRCGLMIRMCLVPLPYGFAALSYKFTRILDNMLFNMHHRVLKRTSLQRKNGLLEVTGLKYTRKYTLFY